MARGISFSCLRIHMVNANQTPIVLAFVRANMPSFLQGGFGIITTIGATFAIIWDNRLARAETMRMEPIQQEDERTDASIRETIRKISVQHAQTEQLLQELYAQVESIGRSHLSGSVGDRVERGGSTPTCEGLVVV